MYIVKSNLLVFFMIALPISFLYGIMGDTAKTLDSTLISMLIMAEAFIVKIGYDYINYDFDYKNFKHRLPKKAFMILPIILNVLGILVISLITGPYRWLLLITLVISNVVHILLGKTLYLLPLVGAVLFSNLIYIYREINIFYWLLVVVMAYLPLAYWLINRKVKIHTNDNYD